MKYCSTIALVVCTILLAGCGDNVANNDVSSSGKEDFRSTDFADHSGQTGGIVGEWEQQFSCFDKNGNYNLDADERKPAERTFGFDWFRFNSNGTCVWDKGVQWEGTWSIDEKTSKKKVKIKGGDSFSYNIEELTGTELVLGKSGSFMVLKRVK